MIPLRRFTDSGIHRFQDLIDTINREGNADVQAVIFDDELTEIVTVRPVLRVRPFDDRFNAGRYFHELLEAVDHRLADVERDRGLWTWLAGAWMDEIAPAIGGKRSLGDAPRWILSGDFRRYYRHLLAGPFRIYRAHRHNPEGAMALLTTAVAKPGEIVEQLASRQEIVSNTNLLQAITRLYYDPTTGRLKRGSGSKGPGGPRRLARDILPQFDLTWDFYGMDPTDILHLLPREFDRFLESRAS